MSSTEQIGSSGKNELRKSVPAHEEQVHADGSTDVYDNSPLSVFLSTFKAARTQWVARQVIIIISLLFRLGVGLGPYSGFNDAPMHGDFEAQRHWMEITLHLPMKKWYWYDLQYWGLDYPPLTAYHSWLLGYIGKIINPDWFALESSRGCENENLKSYMRLTVLVSEAFIYIPAVSMFIRYVIREHGLSPLNHSTATAAILLQPALILIDHGHFQYNSVMLGLTLLGITNIFRGRLFLGSIFFVLSLSFKQMALYYALPIFAYLLGICVKPRLNFLRFISLAVSVVLTFGVVFAPLLLRDGFNFAAALIQLKQILLRVFPFDRGLWEDKVANIWCALNTFIKLRELYSQKTLQRLSLAATLLVVLPVCILLLVHPKKKALVWGVSASAWGFFLCSFQVHEKSVLLPLLPVTLMLADSPDSNTQSFIYWINNVAVFSMWPLLKRDGLALQCVATVFLWNWLMVSVAKLPKSFFGKLIILLSYAAIGGLCILEATIPTPTQYPDIWVVANVTLCFGCFSIFTMWNYMQLYKACVEKS
ncbi:glycosyl transferase [Lipomyces arxii]|uniref:glycosyl transferase n=1 Tax=Lipomyces arxii TaxID=56418 RepID=UPI0034CFF71C